MTDPYAESKKFLKNADKGLATVTPASEKRGGFTNDELIRLAGVAVAKAQVLATLALVDAQREANDLVRKEYREKYS